MFVSKEKTTISMKSNLKIGIIFLILLTFLACEDPVKLNDISNPAKIVVQCRVVEGEIITARISTSLDINGNGSITFPEDAICQLILESGDILDFEYGGDPKTSGEYQLNYVPTVGEKLEMWVKLQNSDIGNVVSNLTIPNRVDNFTSNEQISYKEIDEESYEAEIISELEFEDEIGVDYLNVKARLEYHKYEVSESGDTTIFSTRKLRYLDFDLDYSSPSISELTHRSGVYVDLEKSNKIQLVMNSSEAIPNNYMLTDIHYEFNSMTKDLFLYDLCIESILASRKYSYVEPIITHTNIENGIGVFGASSKITKIVSIK